MKIACLRIVLRHVPVLQLHVHVQAQVMIRLETIFREMYCMAVMQVTGKVIFQ